MTTQFQKDLKKGMTIEEALIKNNLDFKTAIQQIKPKRKPYNCKKLINNPSQYISLQKKKYVLRKFVKGKTRWFGTYNTLEDAIKVREYMKEHGWDQDKVDEVCEIVGVKRSYYGR